MHREPDQAHAIPRITRRWALWLIAVSAGLSLSTIVFYSIVMDVSQPYAVVVKGDAIDPTAASKPVVRIAVISRYPPTVTFRGYQPIMDYLTARTPYRFELLLGSDYAEALQHLLSGKAAAVFLGSYLYARERERADIIPILKPLNEQGEAVTRSVLFVRSTSTARAIGDLRGRRLALPSAESYSANWAVAELLPSNGLAEGGLAAVQNFAHHHTVIAKVLNGSFDAGITREHLIKDLVGSSIRVIATSVPIPSPPIVVRRTETPAVIAAIREALLEVGRDEERRRILTKDWDIEFVHGFAPAAAEDYEPVRRWR
ncbi:MAG: PhnD/SsuA/transferrin family substrate-binding protein [Bacteroidetes bacterium]|jgi:phosphonate transport system substrate-binding protein|nr:PhnD/SsuA/transferrin family substrate-binding protein [Bacteroidota bacterium]